MAKPTTLASSKLLIEIEGDVVGEFVAPCALATKGLNITAETTDTNVPDCDNPDAPAWTERSITALSWDVPGNGALACESYSIWREWMFSAALKPVRVILDTAAPCGGYYAGEGYLTQFNTGANQGELAAVDLAITGSGPLVWTDGAAP